MKLQHKIALMIFVFGSSFLLLVTSLFYFYSRSDYVENLHLNLQAVAKERAKHIDISLKGRATIAQTISNSPIIIEALASSNSKFAAMTEDERQEKIRHLNDRWKKATGTSNPFVRHYMDNPGAGFLKSHMDRNPGVYGEIFLTNRYGSVVSTTGKLTTLAHANKYWWIATFADGKGRVFFDDRGFDSSVQGYVTGVVVPVMKDGVIIGILKCNLNVMDILTHAIEDFKLGETGILKIVRSGGAIVLEKDKEPLSTKVPDILLEGMGERHEGSIIIEERGEKLLNAYTPISITLGSTKYGFGGSRESIDHINGNKGELWYLSLSQNMNEALSPLQEKWRVGMLVGLITIMFMGLLAIFFGRRFALPVIRMGKLAKRVGEGDFDVQMDVQSKDELGHLAEAFNVMTLNLRDAKTAQKQTEDKINAALKEKELLLGEIHHRVKNNLQVAHSLLGLQSVHIEDKQALAAMKESQSRIKSMALVHNLLYESKDLINIDFNKYVNKLVDSQFQLYGTDTNKVSYKVEIKNTLLGIDDAVPCGLIINELVSNSLKYAFPQGVEGEIRITFQSIGDNECELTIGDNGVGIPEDQDFENISSFGWKMVKLLAEGQLQGTVELNRKQGTEYCIRFRTNNHKNG